jgi:hypothetical protein
MKTVATLNETAPVYVQASRLSMAASGIFLILLALLHLIKQRSGSLPQQRRQQIVINWLAVIQLDRFSFGRTVELEASLSRLGPSHMTYLE